MSYRQLTLDERYQIQAGTQHGLSVAAIARQLGRHRTTVAHELKRNRADGEGTATPYEAKRAQDKARQRRADKGVAQRLIQGELQVLVEQKLRQSWSPEQISGRLRLERGIAISHETIYQHVLRDTHERRGDLRYCLRFAGYKQHRFRKSRHGQRSRARKNKLDQRPVAANERLELGHWERDCLLGRGGAALLTVVDRKSRYVCIRAVSTLTTDAVADATIDALKRHRAKTKTITNDNGSEFQRDAELQKRLGLPIYFCDPSSPWQRGSVENLNGLLRQYVPKRTNFAEVASWVPAALENTLNHRPRKVLGFRTPHEIFFDRQTALTKGTLMRLGLEFTPRA